ncbi:unnamed protein product [Larinioides sclopetarius]|uniref:Secreted protein n=1 Tax=Larinioides sclopetarius TaxID=280406 RepID=A0AAV2A9H9_9ARAC
MWTALMIVFAITGGKVESTSQECDSKLYYCHNMYPEAQMKAALEVPNEEELEELCPQMPYVLGCVAAEIQSSCGTEAAETFIQVEKLKDSTDWIKFCLNNLEYKNEIYADFLPSIQIAENLRSQINKVLDVNKEAIKE